MGHYAAEMGYNEELSSEELKEIYQREQKKTAKMFPSGWCIGVDFAKEGTKDTTPMKCQGFNHPCDSDEAERYRMNTQYINEESNYMVLCKDCQKDSDECWQEMWEEYYSAQGLW